MELLLFGALFALVISFFCSLMEATLLSLTPGQISDITDKHPGLGNIWKNFKTDIERPIAVILIINTAAHTIGASIAGAEFDKLYGDRWIWIFSLVFTLVMIQFTEILPKTLGVVFSKTIASFSGKPLNTAVIILDPLIRLIHWINRPILKLGKQKEQSDSAVDEIAALAAAARLSSQISRRQERIIKGASKLDSIPASRLMTPLDQISFLSNSQTIPEALIAAHKDAHTRFPVCDNDNPGAVIGYINFKELVYYMRTNPNETTLKGVIRPVPFASEDASASDLLELCVSTHTHLVILQNGEKRVVGMVTLEDITEIMFGDIEDEFDRMPETLQELAGSTWMAGGNIRMASLNKLAETDFTDKDCSLAEWMTEKLGKMPASGDIYAEQNYEFLVRRTRRGQVYEVSIVKRGE